MVDKPKKFMPALIGGAVLCVLSLIPYVNYGCCLWVIAGGAVAAYMLIKRSPVLPVTTGNGASVGALAGLLGSLLYLIIFTPIFFAFGREAAITQMQDAAYQQSDPNARRIVMQMVDMVRDQPLVFILIWCAVIAVFFVAFSTLGGILGVAMFEKRKGQPMPPMAPPGAPGYGRGFAPPGPPPSGPAPPPGEPPYGGGDRPPY
ncbi:MAG TPA: hypothetical protein VF131_05535 [Blastocatellia bacterium]|nr:hypothetical protein [Blastocatellia bacterium]